MYRFMNKKNLFPVGVVTLLQSFDMDRDYLRRTFDTFQGPEMNLKVHSLCSIILRLNAMPINCL